MKKILITGAGSYIGTRFEKWLKQYPDKYFIDTIDMEKPSWKNKDFSRYDVIFHVAGIAHVSSDPEMKNLYYKINKDLVIETAKKAKNEGVKQFVFMSSIIVYGDSGKINKKKIIDENTEPAPSNFYGDSKLQAEKGILPLEKNKFNVVILRPPMIYGKGSRGNYQKLSKFARITPIFPDIDNQRSMLHIDNLCEFVRLMIDNEESGIFYPQNNEYVKTSKMVKQIGKVHNHKVRLTSIFNGFLNLLSKKLNIINKVFGNLVYKKSMSEYKEEYRVRDFEESIRLSEGSD